MKMRIIFLDKWEMKYLSELDTNEKKTANELKKN